MEPSQVIKQIKGFITSTKRDLTVAQLNRDFKTLGGEWIPFERMGYGSLEELFQQHPDFSLVRKGNESYVIAKSSSKSAHMVEMVAKQKSEKKKPAKFGFIKYNCPPRMQHNTTSKWRPMANQKSHNGYGRSSRPQAIRHTQFVNKVSQNERKQEEPPIPKVASKIVIPEKSNLNPKRKQPTQQEVNVSQPVKIPTELNQRMNMNRIQENIMALLSDNSNNAPKKSQSLIYSHNGTSIASSFSPTSVEPNISNPLEPNHRLNTKHLQGDLREHLNAMRSGINNMMSSLSLDSDSGNCSPTKEVYSDFIRTDDPKGDLQNFALLHKLGEVSVNLTQMSKTNKFYSCKVKIGSKHTYTSYPNEFKKPMEAIAFCCEEALADLIPKYKRKSLLISSESDILSRLPPLLEKHNFGIWAEQLKADYEDKFNELLSDDWLKIIDSSSCVRIEKVSDDYVLYHCKPGDKGQNGPGTPLSKLSIPANTVQFNEDNRLVALVTYVVSANEVWCQQIETDENVAFTEMFDRLQVNYEQRKMQPDTILQHSYYIAKVEGIYYRVRTIRINEDDVDCFLIDYGSELAVPKTDIFVLARFYATSQAQAFVCRLFGLEGLQEMSNSSKSFADSLLDRAVVIELVETDTNTDENILPVLMYDPETGNSINEEFLNASHAEIAWPQLQPDGITEVYVSNIESNGDVYVQVRTQGYESLKRLQKQIEAQIAEKAPTEILYKITKSNSKEKLYFIKHNGNWYRAKLIDWSPDGEFAQIYFIDEGHASVIRISSEILYPLEILNDAFNNYPYQALRTRMALEKIPENFKELANKELPRDSPILLKVVNTIEDAVPVVKMYKRNQEGGLYCINESIEVQLELSSKEDHLKLKLSNHANSDKVPSTGLLKCPPLPEVGGGFYKLIVPVAIHPHNFFVQPYDSNEQLYELMERLQARYEKLEYGTLKVENVLPGSIYAAKYEDGCWYRISVIKVINSASSVSVFYCDFGNYQTLPVKYLVPLDKEFMELPYQALKAKLAGIKPKQNKWTVEDCDFFKKYVEKKTFFGTLISMEKDYLYESDKVLKLALCDTSSQEDVDVAKELIDQGIAVKDD
ncbi:tudor domain-containing protein 7B isoform X2 [Anthonomus grandis grandis]|uniref:tudor domain-containing protein 7B isoform X2 n=1 Tax=Anthonomus grandis grandis TaxID=2921223 RepID=UPI0021652BC3|nr:tudor domain-containing protein 7B isoform X2 [Anthonomus grandis grandis]